MAQLEDELDVLNSDEPPMQRVNTHNAGKGSNVREYFVDFSPDRQDNALILKENINPLTFGLSEKKDKVHQDSLSSSKQNEDNLSKNSYHHLSAKREDLICSHNHAYSEHSSIKRPILAEKHINEFNNISSHGSPCDLDDGNMSGLSLISDNCCDKNNNSYNFTLSDNKKDIGDIFRIEKPHSKSPTNNEDKHNNR